MLRSTKASDQMQQKKEYVITIIQVIIKILSLSLPFRQLRENGSSAFPRGQSSSNNPLKSNFLHLTQQNCLHSSLLLALTLLFFRINSRIINSSYHHPFIHRICDLLDFILVKWSWQTCGTFPIFFSRCWLEKSVIC